MKNVVWTSALAAAAAAIANDPQRPQDREELANDIRCRAREMTTMWPGLELQPFQVDFVQCFRSRLHDPCFKFAGEDAFEEAWSEAYRLANA